MPGRSERLSSAEQQGAADRGYRPGYEIAAERILEYIVKARLEPGDRLPTEKDLAEAVGMSRTIVREAVKILSALGRISVQMGRGIYVAEPEAALWRESLVHFLPTDLGQVEEIFEFRRFVETKTTELAAQRATPAQVKALREAARLTADAAAQGDLEAFNRADEKFHGAIGDASSNMFLSASVDSVQRLQRQVSVIGLAGVAGGSTVVAAEQHAAIAAAIGAGDEQQAVALMIEHIDTTLEQFKQEIHSRVFPADGTA
ncbi:FCD domain-containing protein [Kribbella sp. NPDC003557]|uniref:FadR/GntR family transcriptional regulator n=1 Tax=Kribbella sp. NPDC003557 TaxID=3154449 RepID=UPI0033B7AF6B